MPAFKNRGIMFDPARQMEKKSYFNFILPWLKEWGYNTIHMHLTDDQGCALEFDRFPMLATEGAFTGAEMKKFVTDATSLGIEVIPEIESLGHTQFITRHPEFKNLGAGTKTGADGFNAIDPGKAGTRKLLKGLYEETARLFSNNIIHVGLDEVDFSQLPRFKGKGREECWPVFAEHAAWAHEEIRKLGKRPAMWGDHILITPKMADKFKRDVLIFDWHYQPDLGPDTLRFFCDRKFEVWGVPATMCWRARILSSQASLSNTREFSANALPLRRKGVTGMVNTVWCPWRYLSGAMDWPIALAGHLFSVEKEDPAFCAHFCRSFYGLSASDAGVMAGCFKALHTAVPLFAFMKFVVTGTGDLAPFSREHARRCGEFAEEYSRLAKRISPIVRRAHRNAERLNDVVLSARYLERLGRFGENGRSTRGLPSGRQLMKQVSTAWDRVKIEKSGSVLKSKAGDTENMLVMASKIM